VHGVFWSTEGSGARGWGVEWNPLSVLCARSRPRLARPPPLALISPRPRLNTAVRLWTGHVS